MVVRTTNSKALVLRRHLFTMKGGAFIQMKPCDNLYLVVIFWQIPPQILFHTREETSSKPLSGRVVPETLLIRPEPRLIATIQ